MATVHQHRGTMLCQLCHQPCESKFYDAMIPMYRQWGNVCPNCFEDSGASLGTGRGQEYSKPADALTWTKTAG